MCCSELFEWDFDWESKEERGGWYKKDIWIFFDLKAKWRLWDATEGRSCKRNIDQKVNKIA